MYKLTAALALSSYAVADQLLAYTNEEGGDIQGGAMGVLQYNLGIYTDSDFTTLYDKAVHDPFKVGLPLYFKVDAAHPINSVDFSLLNCVVKNSDEQLEYPIIESMCPDTKVGATIIGDAQSTTSITASYEVFEFIADAQQRDNNQVHISCEVVLCKVGDIDSTCSSGCQAGGRKRRSIDMTQVVQLSSNEFSLQ